MQNAMLILHLLLHISDSYMHNWILSPDIIPSCSCSTFKATISSASCSGPSTDSEPSARLGSRSHDAAIGDVPSSSDLSSVELWLWKLEILLMLGVASDNTPAVSGLGQSSSIDISSSSSDWTSNKGSWLELSRTKTGCVSRREKDVESGAQWWMRKLLFIL